MGTKARRARLAVAVLLVLAVTGLPLYATWQVRGAAIETAREVIDHGTFDAYPTEIGWDCNAYAIVFDLPPEADQSAWRDEVGALLQDAGFERLTTYEYQRT